MDFLNLPSQYFIKQALPKNQSLEEQEGGGGGQGCAASSE